MAQRWQIARGGHLISLTHRPPPPYIYLSPPPPTLWHHQLYTSHNNTLHYPAVYSLAILSDHLFDVYFPTSLEKCRSTTFVPLSLARSPPFAYGLSGTCYSRLPSKRMLLSKSFRSELFFYPPLVFIFIRVSYLLTLIRAKDQARSQGGSIRHEYSLIKGFT